MVFEDERIDWELALASSGFTRRQMKIAAKLLEKGLADAHDAQQRATALEHEVTRLRTMMAALVDHLAERQVVDLVTLGAKVGDALAKLDAEQGGPAAEPTTPYR